jgi:hypothetical protein
MKKIKNMKLFLKISCLALLQSSLYARSYMDYWYQFLGCERLNKRLAYAVQKLNDKVVVYHSRASKNSTIKNTIPCSHMYYNQHVYYFPSYNELANTTPYQKNYEKVCQPYVNNVKALEKYIIANCKKPNVHNDGYYHYE